MNYNEFANLTRSVKSILAHAFAKQQAKIFTLYSDSVYSRVTSYFVSSVEANGVELTQASSVVLNAGEFYFDIQASTLYIRMIDSSNPFLNDVFIKYKIFLADKPYNLPHDLSNGEDVEYLPLIKSIGELKFDLDYEQTGIAVETNSSITLENTGGYFDDIFDTLIFENQRVDFFSWSPQIELSQSKKIYSGFVKDKTFSSSQVSFSLVDAIYQLRKPVQSQLFSDLDGDLSDDDIGTVKKRVYGRVQTMKTTGLDKVLDGFSLTGVSGTIGATTITGTGFLQALSPEDRIKLTIGESEYEYVIDDVTNDTTATLSDEIEQTFTSYEVFVEPNIPYRFKNRRWHIAGHKLHEFTSTITEVVSSLRIRLLSVDGLMADDLLDINGQIRRIRRISEDLVTLTQVLSPLPLVNDTVTRSPIYEVYVRDRLLVQPRDFTITNTTEAIIELEDLAEYNITKQVSVPITFSYTNGSRTISTTADVDLKTIFQTRDWIRSSSISHATYYEILKVNEKNLTIRTAYAGTTASNTAKKIRPEYIEDDTLVTVSCLGLERSGEWIRTPSQIVKDLTLNDAELTGINNTLFNEAKEDCPYIASYVIDKEKKVRDAISDINNSCFGSLYQDQDFNLAYKVLNADKDEELEPLQDDDIISFSVKTKNSIINKVVARYRPFTDVFSGNDSFKVYEFDSEFVNNTSQIKEAKDVTLFLYDDQDAQTIAQRYALFNSLTQNVITVKSKLNLALKSVNDKMYIVLDRMFKRFGAANRRKIGIINSISKNESSATVEFNDLSGVFTRVPAIAPNTTDEYLNASDDDKAKFGFILDNDTLTPDNTSEDELGNFIIG